MSENQASIFDTYLNEKAGESANVVVHIGGKISFVFRRVRDFDDIIAIRQAAATNATNATKNGPLHESWKAELGSNPARVMGLATHFAKRHIGFLVEKPDPDFQPNPEFVPTDQIPVEVVPTITVIREECIGELGFLKMAKRDPDGFQAIVGAFDEIATGWWVESDSGYFREDPATAQG